MVSMSTEGIAGTLQAYFPRLVTEWERDAPGALWREIDGTLVFIDISGFTAMSERLARKGKVGAEEVTDVISTTFARLLASAYDEGGSLLKFGGDALLLFFSGGEHETRGCRAAMAMREELRRFGKFRTSAGLVGLQMSVGINSGAVTFFLAGGSHRELIVAGPVVTGTVAMESTAQAGEILVNAATARAIDAACLGDARAGGRFLLRAPVAVGGDSAAPPAPAVENAELYIPDAIRRRLRGVVESEHRRANVAFIHFDGTDEMIASHGAAEVASWIDALVRAVQDACAEFDVCFLASDIDRDGGKIILTAGVPRGGGNDEERMLRAVRAIADAPLRIPLRTGVNRGEVFAGDVGPAYRRTYTVMGDAVNLAARVMAQARPGQVLATRDVIDRSGTEFELQELEPFRVKGKAELVTAYAVGAVRGAVLAPRAPARAPFVGREEELRTLLRMVEGARGGTTTVVEVAAEPGMGKSRLVEEFRAQVQDVAWAQAAAEQYQSSTPYFGAGQVVRAVLGIDPRAPKDEARQRLEEAVRGAAPELLPWLPLIGDTMGLDMPATRETAELDVRFRKSRLSEAVRDLLVRLVAGPAVLVVEDAHWLDEASLELLSYIVASVERRPWMILVCRRPGRPTDMYAVGEAQLVIELQPLSEAASLALAASVAREAAVPEHELRAFAERTAGNPLFLQEIVASRVAQPSMESLPDSIDALLVARIDSLPPDDRRVLRYASVFGPAFHPEALLGALGDALGEVDRRTWDRLGEFIRPDDAGALRFRHALVREVAYDALPFRRRRDLHERTGLYFERLAPHAEDIAELLSLHFVRAQSYERAYRYSRIAADRSRERFANVEAAEFYRRAVESARRSAAAGDELRALYEGLGDVCELAGLYDEAASAYRDGRALVAGSASDRRRFLRKEGIIRERLGRYAQALRWYGRALADCGPDDVHDRIELHLAYAGVRFRQGRYAECARWCLRTLDEASASGERAQLAHAYYLLDHAYTFLGSDESAKYRSLALPIYEELGDLIGQANVLTNLGVAAVLEGRWDDGLALSERAREASERAGDVVAAATAGNNIGEIMSDQGKVDEARALFEGALRVFRGARYTLGIAHVTSNLARADARGRRFDEASSLFERAIDEFRALGSEASVLEAEARRIEMLVLAGDAEGADAAAQLMLDRADRVEGASLTIAMLHRVRGDARVLLGDAAGAAASYEESLLLSRPAGADYEVAASLDGLARAREMTGAAPNGDVAESRDIRRRLGIVAVWSPHAPAHEAAPAGT